MTLYQQLRSEMESHREFWNYYDMKFEDVFQNGGAASDFIYNYFQRGSKLYTLDTWINSQNEHFEMRNVHTVNVFFIGAFYREQWMSILRLDRKYLYAILFHIYGIYYV